MLTTDQIAVLSRLSQSWPSNLSISIRDGAVDNLHAHPLRAEITGFQNGDRCSLPFFRQGSDEVAWVGMAPNSSELQSLIQDLRSWIIPSFGWQDSEGWLVTNATEQNVLARLLLTMSPAGYCRWRSRRNSFGRIVEKLQCMRALEQSRPQHVITYLPSLLEARQRFLTALIAGDRQAADAAIELIDRNKLDSADNTLFMRVRCWDRFGDIDRIVKGRELDRLTHLQLPHRIRLCILRAFHETFLAQHEEDNDPKATLEAYRLDVHERLAGMIRLCQPSDGQFVLRMLTYRAVALQDETMADQLSQFSDEFLESLLSPLLSKTATETPLEERFFEARKRQDWAEVQRLGVDLLEQGPEYKSILTKSLEHCINPTLETLLCSSQDAVTAESKSPRIPQSWSEWFSSLTDKFETQFQPFLDNRQKPELRRLEPSYVASLHDVLERFYVESSFETDTRVRQLLLSGLPEFMDDFIVDLDYPRDALADIYLDLFRLWAVLKRGSVYPPDGQVLLNLAEGVLQFLPLVESEIVGELKSWWETRPVKALLPFLLGIVDLLDHVGTKGQCENFWVVGAEFLRHNQPALTPGERALWRQIGSRIGFDEEVLNEYLPIPSSQADADPLWQTGLGKVAIISMRVRQAREAADLIRERSGADVLIVSDKVPGASTDSALTAEVVLFVWSATTHAVFRAFDQMTRDRIEYVQGTSAAAIVMAMERWLLNHLSDEGLSKASS